MKFEVLKKVEVELKYLRADFEPRYFEDSTVNGVEDVNGDLMPGANKGVIIWKIDITNGKIINWDIGKTAKIHYKVCDQGEYHLLDENEDEILKSNGYYVPNSMCPDGNGYGDYIIMKIDNNGIIEDFQLDIEEFSPLGECGD